MVHIKKWEGSQCRHALHPTAMLVSRPQRCDHAREELGMRVGRAAGWAMAAALAAAPAAAQAPLPPAAPPAAPAAAKQGWLVDHSGLRCLMSRGLEGAPRATLAVRSLPGSGDYDLILASHAWPRRAALAKEGATLSLAPGGPAYDRRPSLQPLAGYGKALTFESLPTPFLEEFAKAASLSLAVGGKPVASYDVPLAGAAARAFAACEAEKLVEWGADPTAFEPGGARARPVGDTKTWLNPRNFIPAPGRTGRFSIALRFDLGLDGRPERCQMLESTGVRDGGTQACEALMRSARYEPARDKAGRPVRSVAVYSVAWVTVIRTEAGPRL
jgi:hypothetical protein